MQGEALLNLEAKQPSASEPGLPRVGFSEPNTPRFCGWGCSCYPNNTQHVPKKSPHSDLALEPTI